MTQRWWWISVLALALQPSCSPPGANPSERRVELRQVGPAAVRLVPSAGQLPFCLVFTASTRGVVRQLTMAPDRQSVPCKAGEPIGGVTYRIPPEEGKAQLYVVFSDQPIKADPIATQVHELATAGKALTAMDLRAPGKVQLETLEFTPSAEAAP